ncbi:unnamed protein product [Amaranthus hypochondriacus]
MECIGKSGFGPKQQQQNMEDFSTIFSPISQNFNGGSSIITPVSGDDFFVDQLLNLNNEEEEENEPKIDFLVKQQQFQDNIQENIISSFSSSPLDSVLSVPEEEAQLEWLSEFVEESFSQFSNPYPPGFVKSKPNKEVSNGLSLFFTPPSHSKSRRSKRARTGGRVWSNSVSDPSSTSPSSPELGPFKKHKKKENGSVSNGLQRRCSHCGVHKTPQWRAGPMGAKTLCNACGVRFKSGRLLPEYRPACSPTFSSELHSNSHRKVLEMRKKKEMVTGQPEPGSMSHPVSSFG